MIHEYQKLVQETVNTDWKMYLISSLKLLMRDEGWAFYVRKKDCLITLTETPFRLCNGSFARYNILLGSGQNNYTIEFFVEALSSVP